MTYLIMAGCAFLITLVLTPLIKWVSVKADAYARENKRTVHHGKISRIGGVGIYIAYCVCAGIFLETDQATIAIFISASVMFFTGLYDDFFDIKPRTKLIWQILAGLILVADGVGINALHLPFGISVDNWFVSAAFTLVWVIGIINAVNLSDGLDGLAGGMCVVIFSVITAICIVDRRTDIIPISIIIIGALLGFLVYNAHPASIFMGDCGSLFLGCIVASVSLLGFKSSTIMTLALPILILLLPIIDTFSAILRRKLKGSSFSEADKQHMHHQLMFRFGQEKTVIIMCGITFLFGMSAFVYIYSRKLGFVMMAVMLLAIDIFIEKTGMISPNYRPVLSVINRLLGNAGGKKTASRQNSQD